jgi:3-methylfumaryl-CoA hydratase
MWAGSRLTFHRPLRVGERVDRRSTVTAVTDKQGRGGRLVFVTVRHSIGGAGEVAIEEEQDLVYRGPPAPATEPTPGPPVSPASRPAEPVGAWRRQVRPSVTLLFRYSALTFNGHRIHYDRQYAEAVDGYAGLVVHAPLIATLLLDSLERARPDRTVERFHFKAIRPTFDVSPFAVCGAPADDPGRFRLWSTDNAGRTAIEADAWAG